MEARLDSIRCRTSSSAPSTTSTIHRNRLFYNWLVSHFKLHRQLYRFEPSFMARCIMILIEGRKPDISTMKRVHEWLEGCIRTDEHHRPDASLLNIITCARLQAYDPRYVGPELSMDDTFRGMYAPVSLLFQVPCGKTTKATVTPQRISFDDIPKELRLTIYEHLIPHENGQVIPVADVMDSTNLTISAITRGNKLIRKEILDDVLPKFYSRNTFHITIASKDDGLIAKKWLNSIPSRYHQYLTKLTITSLVKNDTFGGSSPWGWRARFQVFLDEHGNVSHWHAFSRAVWFQSSKVSYVGKVEQPAVSLVEFWHKLLGRTSTGWAYDYFTRDERGGNALHCGCESGAQGDWVRF